jgi:hypothetical protein
MKSKASILSLLVLALLYFVGSASAQETIYRDTTFRNAYFQTTTQSAVLEIGETKDGKQVTLTLINCYLGTSQAPLIWSDANKPHLILINCTIEDTGSGYPFAGFENRVDIEMKDCHFSSDPGYWTPANLLYIGIPKGSTVDPKGSFLNGQPL